ncbi:hypothetical protein [Curtobacterium sp. L1-20]|uniref:hypothetical protein n=1 Tax=Curtobacterium sp. L1-20 TaxID=3138181 RepID=UPI003B51A365
METLIAWSGFLGAWLLVAGPLYQGVLELREEDTDQAGADPASPIAPPPPPSAWWWFLTPVMLVLRRRRSVAYHRTVLAVMTPRQRAHRERFIRKATGWFVVAVGGCLIAVKETWELTREHEWHPAVFPVIVVVMLALVGANTVWQASRWSGATPPRSDET